jgi:NADPH-dependent 2,4-dienoyl-CoA reductase/sulfur reductase-like enzyme
MEAAAYLASAKKAKSVTVVGMESVPFERVLGKQLGALFQALHEARGIKFVMNTTAASFAGSREGAVTGVVLKSGETLPAELVIIGAGIIPSVGYLKDTAGVSLLGRAPGGVVVNEFLQAASDIYAAGDCAVFPYAVGGAGAGGALHQVRIEHWDVAIDMGRCAALNMLGRGRAFSTVPFFWTQQFGKSLRYAGHAQSTEDVIIQGTLDLKSPAEASFVAYYVVAGVVAAVATFSKDPQGVAAMELFRLGALPSPEQLRGKGPAEHVDLVALLAAATARTRRPSDAA